uniref:Transcription repressor n=1 Tax=Cicer arietinum TaxID=3827 RepID=A0A1S2Y156_CICAR|nr:transcription repressor OFP6 isoform X1 [Cicer arietinum]
MSSSKKKLTLNTVSVNLGCGTCKRPKFSLIFNPKPKPKKPIYQKNKLHHHDNNNNNNSSCSFSPCSVSSEKSSLKGFGRVGNEGVAVEKDSDDPYLDFRHSMLQMILENEIYSKDDLRELLNCFLQLNSKEFHGIIIRAFTEIWNGVFSVNSTFSPAFHHNSQIVTIKRGRRWIVKSTLEESSGIQVASVHDMEVREYNEEV